ncbi:MAG: Smr/MutS family protein [Proteobacteria bacterium]|nr:Smr/MutS family protein [Pseudomonadota bacterium]
MKRLKPEAPPRPRRKRGDISPEDHALWAHVTRSAKPLPGRKPLDIPQMPQAEPAQMPMGMTGAPAPSAPLKPRGLPPLAGIEKRVMRQLSRGTAPLERRIDLHGMRQAEAHAALLSFIHSAHHDGVRLVLVITGKGGGVDSRGEEKGILRRYVPHWLADPVMRRLVLGFESAARGHGGEGALYVRLRRKRDPA